MPFDGNGNFVRTLGTGAWTTDKNNAVNIVASRHDTNDQDFADGLTLTLTRDGQGKPSADIDWNAKKITNLAAPVASADAATKAYVDTAGLSGSFTGTITGVATPLTGTVSYRIVNNMCTLYLASSIINATSNSSAMTMTGAPVACRPANDRVVRCAGIEGGSGTGGDMGGATVRSDGQLTFWLDAVAVLGGTSLVVAAAVFGLVNNNKGLASTWTITYPL